MKKEIRKITLLLNKIYSKSKKHVSSFNNKKIDTIKEILGILILERITGNLNSIKILLKEFENNPNIEPSIGLILRNNLNLCKIVFKHSEIQDSNNDIFEFYKNIFGENLQKSIKHIKKKEANQKYNNCYII
jgi:hypothetical protein